MALHLRMVCVLNHQVFLYMCVMLSDVMLWHEADLAIFKAMLAPLEDSTNNIVSKEELWSSSVQMNDSEVVVQHV